MHDILHDFQIEAKPVEIFRAISTSKGLNSWWTLNSSGIPEEGELYNLDFGPDYQWTARVVKVDNPNILEWKMEKSDDDWKDTIVGFEIIGNGTHSHVKFYHKSWAESNDHFRRSNYCWASYLRLLKRYIEHGEFVPYEHRLNS